jgi:hypothetical protein
VTCTKVSVVPENTASLPDFTRWPSFPFEGDMRIKQLADPVAAEPPRSGEDADDCVACNTPDDAYIWASERWRVRAMDRPTGLPMVLILECRSHLDLGDLPNLLAAELGVMTVRLERAIRSLDGVARVHVNRWGDGSAHLHMWFLARPYGRLQLRGTFLSLWDDILPTIPEQQWRENLALVAAWLAEFGGQANAEPAHIQWQSPLTFSDPTPAKRPDGGETSSPADAATDPEGARETPSSGTVREGDTEMQTGSAEIPSSDSAMPGVMDGDRDVPLPSKPSGTEQTARDRASRPDTEIADSAEGTVTGSGQVAIVPRQSGGSAAPGGNAAAGGTDSLTGNLSATS